MRIGDPRLEPRATSAAIESLTRNASIRLAVTRIAKPMRRSGS
jgi:hypothetical protein